MSVQRKIKRRNQRARDKDAINEMSRQLEHMQNMPSACTICDVPFERTRETVDTWRVECNFESGVTRLLCPKCYEEAQSE